MCDACFDQHMPQTGLGPMEGVYPSVSLCSFPRKPLSLSIHPNVIMLKTCEYANTIADVIIEKLSALSATCLAKASSNTKSCNLEDGYGFSLENSE